MARMEGEYKTQLIKRIQDRFPGCLILKNDEQYLQGIPDLTVLYKDKYALLEVKRSEADRLRPRPNQGFYLMKVAGMGGFSAYIYPEIEEEVLDEIQRAFES